ncbi:DUF4365 domain-containing protein [Prosthecomicrobium hirschii]|uniref:DUF4365 domain-containing protein n=1 Tax=Prosthecodimorpha hirschii TaxID=665126 RepID=UPI0009F96612|nr:DUF4365 domain-containing protein [Prosthecomicrobium hirschii]
MRTRGNLVTERAGVNYVRDVVEGAGCLLKEINLQHDFGHDATMMLVVNGEVRPREVALQIKSGVSYVSPTTCGLPATASHIYFWAEHDLVTLGVVYDPAEKSAWWIDLQTAAREFRVANPKKGTTFTFAKGLWNQFNQTDFASILVPTLLGEPPSVPLERLCTWVMGGDIETHDIGVRAIRARYYREAAAWECLIEAFKSKPVEQLTLSLPIALAKLLGHDDIGYYSNEIPEEVRAPAIAKVLTFNVDEISKLLSMLPDGDFDRPSVGYSLMPLFGKSSESLRIPSVIRDNDRFAPSVRQIAGALFEWYRRDPVWWGFWRRDTGKRH